ncbi:Protein CBG05798 [Caenorhabditis briggsae]|uniref:Protein CBG05798 n=1 Tax=Caenorhabditis briggsae TaxID=6238 RepID=A8X1L6_CAEBR|nr:Protein CBG05798 [Caenorhabditis briggsae]CAP26526.2 Protein CBG05798 [Caenorhabditis briggsae]
MFLIVPSLEKHTFGSVLPKMQIYFPLLFFIFTCSSIVHSLVISTSLGKLDGKQVEDFHLFKKIPFAKPPVGKLRFQKPEPAESWNGILNAQEYGPACMSNSSVTKSIQKVLDEDCLYINIFTSDNCLKTRNCPVVEYLHGGALHYDSAVMFNDTVILNHFVEKDIVFVIPAFRLGIFSHFVIEDQSIAPNNLALFDILLAMEFIKSEIYNFGGDPNRITLLGHSYGGTVAQILSFSTEVNTDLRIQRSLEDDGYPTYGNSVIRGPIFQEVPEQNFMDTPKNVSALTGCTKYEALSFDSYDDIGVSLGFQNPREVNVKYHQDQKNDQLGFSNKIRDETQEMLVQNKVKVDKLLQNGVPLQTYLYELTYPKHADHTDDLFYIMGVHPFEQDENEKNIGEVYRTMFTNFIKTGEPGIGFERSDLRTSSFFDIYWNETSGDRPKMRTDFEESIMEYWTKEMVHFDQTISKMKMGSVLPVVRSFREPISTSAVPFSYVIFLLLPFLAGFLVAKYCCFRSQKNLYIQLDGNDYPIKNI